MTASRHSLCAMLIALCLAGNSVVAQSAGSIDTISPAAARPGDLVTIHGNGFGAINVQVTVSGAAAAIISANGNQVTFRVPADVAPGATVVTARNPGGQTATIAFTVIDGVILPGPPTGRALDALFDVPPVSADAADVVDGIIMTRLVLRLRGTASVGEINADLLSVGGVIVSMARQFPTLTIAIPRPSDLAALLAVAARLNTAPGISSASLARVPTERDIPAGAELFDLNHLLPTRFPAAWHVRKLLDGCPGGSVPIVVLDHFAPAPPDGFAQQVPNFSLLEGTTPGADSHGYDVTTTLAARFDDVLPTGANPFSTCLQIFGVNKGVLPWTDVIRRVVHDFPAGKFILNDSTGYVDDLPVDSRLPLLVTAPIERARDALDWKELAANRSTDFLVANSAGNEFDEPAAAVYAGLGQAAFDSPMNVAAKTDPTFSFVQSALFWSNVTDPIEFSSIAADNVEFAELQDQIALRGLQGVVARNVVVAGSTSAGFNIEAGFADLVESAFSDRGSDIKAVGESVTVLGPGAKRGTSFAAPQIAGLASYLWLLSPELRALPVETTKQAILDNARSVPAAGQVVDAYAAVLSLDPVDTLCSSSPCIRQTIVDVNGDGRFDDLDLVIALEHYFLLDAQSMLTKTEVTPDTKDWSRFDLNGDGFTGGPGREFFDLDPIGSTRFGAAHYSADLREDFENTELAFDESGVTDLQILCYYAYSSIYAGDTARRSALLAPRCAPITVTVRPASVILAAGGTQQFEATVTGSSDPRVTWSATGGSVTATGIFTAGSTPGTYTVRATSVADPTAFGEASVTVQGVNKVALVSRSCGTNALGVSFSNTKTLLESKNCAPFPPPPYVPPAVAIDNAISVYHYTANYTEDIASAQIAGSSISQGTLHASAEVDVPAIDISSVPTTPNGVRTVSQGSITLSTQDANAYLLVITGTITTTNCCNTSTSVSIDYGTFVALSKTIRFDPFDTASCVDPECTTQRFTVTQLMNTVDVNGNALPSRVTIGTTADSGFTTAGVIQNNQQDQQRKGDAALTFTLQPVR